MGPASADTWALGEADKVDGPTEVVACYCQYDPADTLA